MSQRGGNLLVAVLIGFIIDLALSPFIPILSDILAGAAAGYIAGRSISRGVVAGLLAGMLGGIILAILILTIMPFIMYYLSPILGPFSTLLPLAALIPIILTLKGALLAAIGGLIGAAIWMTTKGR